MLFQRLLINLQITDQIAALMGRVRILDVRLDPPRESAMYRYIYSI